MGMCNDLSKAALLDALRQAQDRIRELGGKIDEYKWLEDALRARTRDLSERTKELDCLHGISTLLVRYRRDLKDVMKDVVNLMPSAWQFSTITRVRVVLNGQEYRSKKFAETRWKQKQHIVAGGKRVGMIQVYYLMEKPESEEGPFLRQERLLLSTIAIWIGVMIERRRTLKGSAP